jgi:hypothetical protein
MSCLFLSFHVTRDILYTKEKGCHVRFENTTFVQILIPFKITHFQWLCLLYYYKTELIVQTQSSTRNIRKRQIQITCACIRTIIKIFTSVCEQKTILYLLCHYHCNGWKQQGIALGHSDLLKMEGNYQSWSLNMRCSIMKCQILVKLEKDWWHVKSSFYCFFHQDI